MLIVYSNDFFNTINMASKKVDVLMAEDGNIEKASTVYKTCLRFFFEIR